MVSILPPDISPWQVIGKAMSQFGQNAPQLIEKRFQQKQGMEAIDELQKGLESAGGDINKILPLLAKAYTKNPNLEKSGLGQTFLQQAQRQKGAGEFPAGQVPTREGSEQGKQVPVSVNDLVPARETSIKNPQGITDFQLPYGPDEVSAIRQKSRELGYLPEAEERYVNDALEYNKIAEARRNIDIQNYEQQQKQFQDTIQNQALFSKYMEDNAKELWENPDDREMSLKSAERILADPKNKNTSFADLLSKVKNEIRPYQAAVNALDKSLFRPLTGMTKAQKDLNRSRAQFMVKNGQKPRLQLMIAKNGHGEVEEADLLNPLIEKFENNLNKFNKVVNPLDFVTNIDPDSKEYNEQLQRGQKAFENQKNHMIDFLSREITSGSYENPGTNLILTRSHLMNKGFSWEDSGKIIDDAIARGKIKLDPQQQIDHMKLSIPPLIGDNYSDTLLNNLLFPITGRQ
jgi:hypothetical protein